MANEVIHTAGKLSDKTILSLFDELEKAFELRSIGYNYGAVSISREKIHELIRDDASQMINSVMFSPKSGAFHVYFERGTTGRVAPNQTFRESRIPSPYFDEVIVSAVDKQQDAIIYVNLEKIIAKYTSIELPKSVEAGSNSAIDLLQKEMAGLTAFHKRMLSDAERQRKSLEEHYQEKTEVLKQKAIKDQQELEDKSSKEKEKISLQIAELKKKQRALDDRDNTHVRRQLREKITTDIQERISNTLLPPGSSRMNSRILTLCVAAAMLAGGVAIYNFILLTQLASSPPPAGTKNASDATWLLIYFAIKGSLSSTVAIGFIVYALSWMKKIYTDNVQTSHELQRYALDINRASWTIETIMDMKKAKGTELPDTWIEGACHGLFRNSNKDKAELTPLDAWGALLNVSGKAEIGPDGPKMEFNKKGTTQLAK